MLRMLQHTSSQKVMAGQNTSQFKRYGERLELNCQYICMLYNNQINARALIGQSAVVYCASKTMEKSRGFELLYASNRPQVSVVYRLISRLECWQNT